MKTSKRLRFSVGGKAHQAIGDAVERAQVQGGEHNFDAVPLVRVAPDPDNPRQLCVKDEEFAWLQDTQAVAAAKERPDLDARSQDLLQLLEKAESIRTNGVLQPIRVYRHGEGYRIAYGERRYWGARLAGLTDIPAWISSEKPARLRTLQLVENIQRLDLDLAGRLRNLSAVMEELGTEGPAAEEQLAQNIGLAPRTIRRYLQVLRGPADVLAAVSGHVVDNLKVAAELASEQDADLRVEILAGMAEGLSVGSAREQAAARRRAVVAKPAKAGRGRPVTKVALGATTNVGVVREIIQRVLGEEGVPELDWSDYAGVAKAWKQFLANLEKSL